MKTDLVDVNATRKSLKVEIPSEVVSLCRNDFFSAEEAFLTGTGARIVPVGSLDGAIVGTGERPIVQRLSSASSPADTRTP